MLEQAKVKVNPKMFGFVHKKQNDEMNLRSFYLSHDYINPFVKSIQLSSQLLKLDLTRT